MKKVVHATQGWHTAGKGPKEKLQTLTNRIQAALLKEVGQQNQKKMAYRTPARSKELTQLRQEANELRRLMGKTEEEPLEKWWKTEIERCTQKVLKKQNLSTSEKRVPEMEKLKSPTQMEIRWHLKKRWQALKKEANKEEEKLLLAHWKQREEVKKVGEDYVPWATHMWKQGKAVQHREPDIIALEDPNTQEIKIEKEMQKVMEEYMQWLWGNKQKKKLFKTSRSMPKEEISYRINQAMSCREVARAIRKLKKNKAPGEDLIPNEVWVTMEETGLEELTAVLEECRTTNQFPKGWGVTEIRWLYKKDDPLQLVNYRPIALTDTLYKIFMRIMTERLDEVVEQHNRIR